MTKIKWKLNEIKSILNKKGFWDTLFILNNSGSHSLTYHEFNNKLNEFSYYNSFLRIKSVLLDKGIITIGTTGTIGTIGKKMITLTEKGIEIHQRLLEIESILNHH